MIVLQSYNKILAGFISDLMVRLTSAHCPGPRKIPVEVNGAHGDTARMVQSVVAAEWAKDLSSRFTSMIESESFLVLLHIQRKNAPVAHLDHDAWLDGQQPDVEPATKVSRPGNDVGGRGKTGKVPVNSIRRN
ncbi:hypothetical protein R3P38DRAFT_2775319 [Favolaschia claudopus]|uniref:Uncharacterized protein n=1 Tax=Favolaschia claudopus TaxID=2862362 RepID=A0AAW0BSR6_9AGAR